ncbi:hypothetical protein BZG02_16085 [Labilibaculum filiforme]|uniref:DUF6377 domain-containing protein n=1 Tax=Labilibaculum filiforme TaxID=1940526 RepID=A0A2N3HTD2_9BACT|nr:DUF6377 domain-containing protein [Labilibaculum filiforme]PKQ61312.1 hypothetical protein BZG02_16085 [Labilibaculum filiforme]
MHRSFILIIFVLVSLNSFSQKDSLAFQFAAANRYLEAKDSIDQVKKNRIALLTDSLKHSNFENRESEEYNLLVKLTKEYEYFVYDSAFQYGNLALKVAYDLKDASSIAAAKTNLSLILLLRGLYKETIDSIQTIDPLLLEPKKRVEFYSVAYRAYYDLSNSRWGYYAPKYREKGDFYVQKIVEQGDANSFEYQLALALKSQNNNANYEVRKYCTGLLSRKDLSAHQAAITNCILGISYLKLQEKEKARYHLLKATVDDIKSTTKETLAAKVLAELLFYDGDLEKANRFISEAQKDAVFYGSNARQLEISFIRPNIEAAVLSKVEKEKKIISTISIIVSLLAFLLILFSFIIYRQVKEVKRARKEILESNRNLLQLNEMLRELSKIKEEYVGYYFNFSSQFIEKLDGMKKAIARQLITKQYDAIEQELKKYNAKKERENLFEDFDRIFLKLFPDFVNSFNLLFEEKDRIVFKDTACLNTDLRIFALIRLGVNDNEKIAGILNFSVNTIYTYKTKIRNRSSYPNEVFDEKIMAIKSV